MSRRARSNTRWGARASASSRRRASAGSRRRSSVARTFTISSALRRAPTRSASGWTRPPRLWRPARARDIVVIAGKGHEDYQIVGTQKRHFDDREVALEALGARESG